MFPTSERGHPSPLSQFSNLALIKNQDVQNLTQGAIEWLAGLVEGDRVCEVKNCNKGGMIVTIHAPIDPTDNNSLGQQLIVVKRLILFYNKSQREWGLIQSIVSP